MNGNKIKIGIFLILTIFITGSLALMLSLKKEKESPEEIHEPITNDYIFDEVYNYNEYQIVYKNILKYYNNLNENMMNVLNLLQEDYVKENNITSYNISNYVEKQFSNYGYNLTQIKKYSNSYYSIYYVLGTYYLEGLDESIEEILVNHIVVLDIINNTYAIIPIFSNESFEDIITKYNLSDYNKEIQSNNYNTIEQENISDFNEVSFYFSTYINMIINDCNNAYDLLNTNSKEKYDSKAFENICEAYHNIYLSPTVKNFSIDYEEGQKIITIRDIYDIKYVFLIKNVLNFSVDVYIK